MKKIGEKTKPVRNPKRIIRKEEVIEAPGIFQPQPVSIPAPTAIPVEVPLKKEGTAWQSPA